MNVAMVSFEAFGVLSKTRSCSAQRPALQLSHQRTSNRARLFGRGEKKGLYAW